VGCGSFTIARRSAASKENHGNSNVHMDGSSLANAVSALLGGRREKRSLGACVTQPGRAVPFGRSACLVSAIASESVCHVCTTSLACLEETELLALVDVDTGSRNRHRYQTSQSLDTTILSYDPTKNMERT